MVDNYVPLFGFMILMVGTPGPANLLLVLGGSQIGLKRCIGFIFGLICGKIALNIFIGFGFSIILSNSPILHETFKYLSAIYMIWLAIRSWNSTTTQNNFSNKSHQFKFANGLVVHPLNPKAWVMSALAWSNFAPALGSFQIQLVTVVLGFATCQLFLHTLWCLIGSIIGKTMPNNQYLTRLMIILTVIIVIWAVTL